MIEGSCRCGAVRWRFQGTPASAEACNCTTCRRYGALLAYGFESVDITVSGTTSRYVPRRTEFHFCPTCGCMVYWRNVTLELDGRRRMAVNLRLAEPEAVARIPIDHVIGLDDSYEHVPRDGRVVDDYWF